LWRDLWMMSTILHELYGRRSCSCWEIGPQKHASPTVSKNTQWPNCHWRRIRDYYEKTIREYSSYILNSFYPKYSQTRSCGHLGPPSSQAWQTGQEKNVVSISINFWAISIMSQQTRHLYLQITGIFSLDLNLDHTSTIGT